MTKTIKSDFTVIGGGYAGISAALAAARQGLSVALINDRDVLGGNASSEHRIHVNGGATGNNSYYSREAGIADELKLTTLHKNPRYNKKREYHLSDMALLQLVLNEQNISYYGSTAAYDCELQDGKITAVLAFCAKTLEQLRFESPLFCDASGDGVIAYRAGAEYRVGREAAAEFDESLAPEKADSCVMGSCILFAVQHAGQPIEYKKPEFAYDFEGDGIINYFNRPETGRSLPKPGGAYNGLWWMEFGGENDTIGEARQIDFELKRLIFSYWDYIKNSGKYPDAEDSEIVWMAPYASKRESRRFIGEYIMTQKDIQHCRAFDNAVATGGWSLDIHDVGGIYGKEKTSAFGEVKSMYNIPFSIMYSKNVPNLFLAGRIVSCTHVAFGSLRVMQTLAAMAAAVGTAAALCVRHNATPSQVNAEHIAELQRLLQRDGQYIMQLPEDCGKAAAATVTASSEKRFQNTAVQDYIKPKRAVMLALPACCEDIELRVKNDSSQPQRLCYTVYAQYSPSCYCKGEPLHSEEIELPGGFDGYVRLPYSYKGESDKLLYALQPAEWLSLAVSYTRVTGAVTLYADGEKLLRGDDAISLCFRCSAPSLYAAENVINGRPRPYNLPNCWVSETAGSEWLQLDFAKPVDTEQLQLYFNAQYETEHFNRPIEQLITDYKITAEHADGLFERTVCGNYLSCSKTSLPLKGVRRIRIDFTANNGAPEYELFAVKLF